MMVVEETGRTPDEAVATGLGTLGIPREYVLVEILSEGARGFLGFGGQEARVRLTVTPAGERLVHGRRTLDQILTLMGVQAELWADERQGILHLEARGEHAGLLIGKRGQTLDALQFLLTRLLDRQLGEHTRVQLDIEGYRERRQQQLTDMALRLAKQVKTTGEDAVLEPMPPGDRRIIHLALQSDREVRTESVGDGHERRVIISRAQADRPGDGPPRELPA